MSGIHSFVVPGSLQYSARHYACSPWCRQFFVDVMRYAAFDRRQWTFKWCAKADTARYATFSANASYLYDDDYTTLYEANKCGKRHYKEV